MAKVIVYKEIFEEEFGEVDKFSNGWSNKER